jgi:ABC-type nitrate/sulfonate/bicarbonate transport system substrate-binding protein
MRAHRKLFLQARIVIIILFSLTLLGCPQKSQEAMGPVDNITLAYVTHTGAILAHIALKKGYFVEERLKVIPQPHSYGKAALNAVLEGKADFATVAETPIVFAITKGKKISIIAEIQTSTKNEAFVARKDLGITKPIDLRGKNIGVTLGTTGDFFMDSLFLVHGITRQDVKIIDMKPEEMLDALNEGRVEAVSTWNPVLKQLQKNLGDKGILFFDENIYTEFFCVATGQEFAKKNPEVVKKFLRALIKAEKFMIQHPEEARQIEAEYTQTDKAIIDEIWNDFEVRVTLDPLLLVTLEDETRWAIKYRLTDSTEMPNYLNFIYFDALQSLKPHAVTIIRSDGKTK